MPEFLSNPYPLALHAGAAMLVVAALLWLRRWPWLYIIATLPGTVAHEVLHYLAGLLTGARPVSLSVLPRHEGHGNWVLGEVRFLRLRWWNSVPVALAPFALWPLGGWVLVQTSAMPVLSAQEVGGTVLVAQCMISGWPSSKDWAHALIGLAAIAAIALLGAFLYYRLG